MNLYLPLEENLQTASIDTNLKNLWLFPLSVSLVKQHSWKSVNFVMFEIDFGIRNKNLGYEFQNHTYFP